MIDQETITVVADIRDGRLADVRGVLERMGADATGNRLIPFARLDTVHFARLVVLDPAVDLAGAPLAASLVFLADIDGPQDAFLERLVDVAGAGLDQVFGPCEGYPERADRGARLTYLKGRMVRPAAAYVNTIGLTVAQVRQEAQLREAIEDYLDRTPLPGDALAIRAAIQNFVRAEPALEWARSPAATRGIAWRLRQLAAILAAAVLLVVLLPLLLLILPIYALLLRRHESSDQPGVYMLDPDRLEELSAMEDHVVQNPFSAIGLLKPGWFRRITATVVLAVVDFGIRHLYNNGSLTGVRTIHFARWVFLNEKRRLIFASNYDGTLESYMDDFIDKVAWGLNAVFSNGQGYPRTRWLVVGGAKDEGAFKQFLRAYQIPTQVWYSAYEQLTAVNIQNNARIRAGLSGPMGATRARAWLDRL